MYLAILLQILKTVKENARVVSNSTHEQRVYFQEKSQGEIKQRN